MAKRKNRGDKKSRVVVLDGGGRFNPLEGLPDEPGAIEFARALAAAIVPSDPDDLHFREMGRLELAAMLGGTGSGKSVPLDVAWLLDPARGPALMIDPKGEEIAPGENGKNGGERRRESEVS